MNDIAVMTDPISVRRLFETHLTVSDLQRSIRFYRNVVGLELACEASERNVAFLWICESGRSMLGLWSLGTAPLGLILHLAFEVSLDDLVDAPMRLKVKGIKPLSFFGLETTEPSVICWMQAASVYFRDPDGRTLEYLTMLDRKPRPDFRDHSLVRVARSEPLMMVDHECDTLSKTMHDRFIFGLLPQNQTASYSGIHTHLVLLDLICHSFSFSKDAIALFLGAQISFIPDICMTSRVISLFIPPILL